VFDVDDLILNTGGAVIGMMLAPLLNVIPGVTLDERERDRARPINRKRRLIQLFCDWLIFTILTAVVTLGISVLEALLDRAPLATPPAGMSAMVDVVVGGLLFVAIPLLTHGETLGERIVLVSVKTPDGHDPTVGPILLKSLAGWVPFVVFGVLGTLGVPGMNLLGLLWIGFSLVFVLRRPEGFSMRASGLRRFDDRVPLPPS
jgi:uncharacterized RDD family membrane protein YckC